ncbi:GNAT family N-acetyltransferase [Micromonospora mangrovi]|uniref:GNAT family N-acetyltransferase n=2 Tax=Micromonospora TaxID=1873 RepID=A0AAU8HH14_9ACTN
MSELVTDPVAGTVVAVLCADASEAVIGEVIADLRHVEDRQALTTDSAGAAAAITDLVEATNQQVFAPDPLAASIAALASSAPAEPAAAAASHAGVGIRPIETHADVAAAVTVLDGVFAPGRGYHFYPPSLLRNLLAAGAPMLLAWDGDAPVGVVLAVPGWTASGQPLVQSGPMAVLPTARGRGVAVALKLAQRAWALERGVTEIRWTFDAMAAVSANLNLRRLGATVAGFVPGYEGLRDADTPTSLPYDRLLVTWRLAGASETPDNGNAEPVWAVAAVEGLPVLNHAWSLARSALVAVPADIAALRREDPAAASTWQHIVGAVLQHAFTAGWRVNWDSRGAYLLTAPQILPGHRYGQP